MSSIINKPIEPEIIVKKSTKRRYLFLQGLTSHFFYSLAKELRKRGHSVDKVNFNVGDTCYWLFQKSHHFRGDVLRVAEYYEQLFLKHQYTDVLVMGDKRDLHSPMKTIAAKYGARFHVIEEGYFRPYWLTLELYGVNRHSQLPKDPNWYREAATKIVAVKSSEAVSNAIWLLAIHEICYHLPNLLNWLLYPGYKTHRPMISGLELFGWAKRFIKMPKLERQNEKQISQLIDSNVAYFFLPLQLDSDAQIIYHSPFNNISEVIETVMFSFAENAEIRDHLVIKNHPLDTGYCDFKAVIKSLADKLGLEGRILYLESGYLPTLLDKNCKGVVTVNSTVGTSSLLHKCPTIALGDAIYDIEGLTFQCGLNRFWNEAEIPDQELFTAFRKVVIETTQVNGGFYSCKGVKIGVDACADLMESKYSPLEVLKRSISFNQTIDNS